MKIFDAYADIQGDLRTESEEIVMRIILASITTQFYLVHLVNVGTMCVAQAS